jgi:hypothetical protein
VYKLKAQSDPDCTPIYRVPDLIFKSDSGIWLSQKVNELVQAALEQDASGVKTTLKEILSGYRPYETTSLLC